MKKIFLTTGICIISLLSVQAQQTTQQAPTVEQRADKMMNALTSACSLTPEQAAKIKPIITEAINERIANKKQYGSDQDKLEAANKETMKEAHVKINAILTADQQSKLAAFEQQQKAAMQQKQKASVDRDQE